MLIAVSSILSNDISKKKGGKVWQRRAISNTILCFPGRVFIVTCVPTRSRPPGLYSGCDGIWVRANFAKTAPHPRTFAPDSLFAHIRRTSLMQASKRNRSALSQTCIPRVAMQCYVKQSCTCSRISGSSKTSTWLLMQRMTLSRPLVGALASRARFARCAAEAVSELVTSRHLAAS